MSDKKIKLLIVSPSKIEGQTDIDGETREKLLDNNYSTLQHAGKVYSFTTVDSSGDIVVAFVVEFPNPSIVIPFP